MQVANLDIYTDLGLIFILDFSFAYDIIIPAVRQGNIDVSDSPLIRGGGNMTSYELLTLLIDIVVMVFTILDYFR